MGAGYVSATSEVVVVSADRALALPSTRPRRALRNKVLKTSQFKTVCVTLACTMPPEGTQVNDLLPRTWVLRRPLVVIDDVLRTLSQTVHWVCVLRAARLARLEQAFTPRFASSRQARSSAAPAPSSSSPAHAARDST